MTIETEGKDNSICGFEVRGLLGLGGTSVVLAALQQNLSRHIKLDRKVALKFIWDLDRARDEVQRLINLDGRNGVSGLIDYFEIEYRAAAHILAPALARRQEVTGEALAFEPDHVFGMLVMQLAQGQNIAKTVPLPSGKPKPGKDEWLIEVDGQPHLQALSIPLTLDEKFAIIRGLIKVIKGAHERKPPQIHGDLHPGNVIFKQDEGEALVIDWSGRGVYGTDGWITPWHDQFLLGEIQALPMQTDLYLLALWVQRLLGPVNPQWQNFAIETMSKLAANQDLTIQAFYQSFEDIHQRIYQRRFKIRTATVALTITLAIAGVLLFLKPGLHKVEEERSEIEAIVAKAIQDESYMEKALELLEARSRGQALGSLEEDIINGMGRIKLHHNTSSRFLKTVDLTRPNCVFTSSHLNFVVYRQFPFSIGTPINESEFIAEISLRGIWVSKGEQQARRLIRFVKHPLPTAEAVDGQLLIYESDLREVMTALASLINKKVIYIPLTPPRIFGLLHGANPEELVKELCQRTGNPFSDEVLLTLDHRQDMTRCLEMIFPTGGDATFERVTLYYLQDRLGYQIIDLPQKLKEVPLTVAPNQAVDIFQILQAKAKEYGYHMAASADGNRILYTKLAPKPAL